MTKQVFGGAVSEPEWAEFVSSWQGLKTSVVTARDPAAGVAVSFTLHRSSRGRVVVPHDSPYVPVTVEHDLDIDPLRLERIWLSLTEQVAREMLRRGVSRPLNLPPGITDVRGIQQAGFRAEPLFTSIVDLPWSDTVLAKKVRKEASAPSSKGFRAGRGADPAEVVLCLQETARRQRFEYGLSPTTIRLGLHLLGEDRFRIYHVRDPDGAIACARIALCSRDGRALGWVAGTRDSYLHDGVTQLMNKHTLEDLSADGFTAFDWAGVNIKSVARAKQNWGGHVTSFIGLYPNNIWGLANLAWRAISSKRARL